MICVCSWMQFCSEDSSPNSPAPFHFLIHGVFILHEGLTQATWVSLERDRILQAKESLSLGGDVLKPRSRLGEQEYFELKKGSRLGEIGSIRSRLGENGSKRWSPLHKLSLRRGPSSLRRNWRPKLSLGRDCFGLSDPAEFLFYFFISPFTLFLFFPPSIIIYLKITQNRDQVISLSPNFEACDWNSFFSWFKENQSWYKHKLRT